MNGLGFIGLELAAVGLVLALLNARDRRRVRAITSVLAACPRALRSSITLHARAAILSRRVVLDLELSDCDDLDIWRVVRHLAEARPPTVTLVVLARLGSTLPIAVRVPARRGAAPAVFAGAALPH